MRKKLIVLFVFLAVIVSLFIYMFTKAPSFEKKIDVIGYNPEFEGYGEIFLDENEDLCAFTPWYGYVFEKYNFISGKSSKVENPEEFDDLYRGEFWKIIPGKEGIMIFEFNEYGSKDISFIGLSNKTENLFRFSTSEIKGFNESSLFDSHRIDSFSLDNGDICVIEFVSNEDIYRATQINPYNEKIINSCEISNIGSMLFKGIVEDKIVFVDIEENNLLFYNIKNGKMIKEVNIPGKNENNSPGCSKIEVYEGYCYLFNKTGIYRASVEELSFEIIVDSSDTKYINDKIDDCENIIVKNDGEIYISFLKSVNIDGTWAKKYIIKYLL